MAQVAELQWTSLYVTSCRVCWICHNWRFVVIWKCCHLSWDCAVEAHCLGSVDEVLVVAKSFCLLLDANCLSYIFEAFSSVPRNQLMDNWPLRVAGWERRTMSRRAGTWSCTKGWLDCLIESMLWSHSTAELCGRTHRFLLLVRIWSIQLVLGQVWRASLVRRSIWWLRIHWTLGLTSVRCC